MPPVRSSRIAALLTAALLLSNVAFAAAKFQIVVDVSAVPKADSYTDPVTQLLTEWYPKINTLLFGDNHRLPFKTVKVVFEPAIRIPRSDRRAVPAYTEGNTIHVDFSYVLRMPGDYQGMLIHELTHVNQHYRRNPGAEWLVEGIADYVRHKYFARDITEGVVLQASKNARGVAVLEPEFFSEGYKRGYVVASSFLFWIERHKSVDIIRAANEALAKGNYSDQIFTKECGQPLSELWQEFVLPERPALGPPRPR